jgi:hypothetical protein
MNEDELRYLLESVYNRETSVEGAMTTLFNCSEKKNKRDVTNKVVTTGFTLQVDCSLDIEYTSF